jgi:hypothetical protein
MTNEESILSCTKKNLGIEDDFTQFDPDVIMCINTALNILTQLGVGPKEGFTVTSNDETWSQFIGDNQRLNMIKNYVSIKTKLMFDPPTTAAVLSAYQEQAKELECRMNYEVDPPNTFEED